MLRQGSLLLAWSALCLALCQCATVPIDRLPRSVMTREVFEEYMNKGRLLVVEGGASEWKALDEWDLDWFISRFPDDAIQLRSARSGMTYEERPQMTLGEYKGWVADKLDGKHYFSWVNNDETVSQQHLQEYFSVPHYFPANAKSHWHPEWIYFGTSRSGVDRHMDTMCSAKWSVHLRGIKKWVLSDPLVRRGPKYTATLQPGDILLFFPQYWHETVTLTNASLSFNSYFDWDDTDNPFLRAVVKASEKDASLKKRYASCYTSEAATLNLATVQAMCAEVMRAGGKTTAGKAIDQMCKDPEAFVRMSQAAQAGDSGAADWVFPSAGRTPAEAVPALARAAQQSRELSDSVAQLVASARSAREQAMEGENARAEL